MPFLDAAIESIVQQTYRNFELLIRDDGSTDNSLEALERWAERDPRIRVFRSSQQLGPAGSSNWIVKRAQHEFIARMDADDISHPERLARQLQTLLGNPEIDLLGTLFVTIDAKGQKVRGRDRSRVLRPSVAAPFAHGSIMYRRQAFDRVGGYRAQCDYWEDHDFFLRISGGGTVAVLPEALYSHRHAPTSTRLRSGRGRVERSVDLGQRCRSEFLRTGSYEQLLAEGLPDRVHTRAILAVGALEVAANEPTGALDRLRRHAILDFSPATVIAFAWATWATLSPGSLRYTGSLVTRIRDSIAARKIKDGSVYRWKNTVGESSQ